MPTGWSTKSCPVGVQPKQVVDLTPKLVVVSESQKIEASVSIAMV